jgi:predicted nucleic acid-binding Zn ribbon protein
MLKPHHLKTFPKKACVVCGAEFQPHSGVHKFCSVPCKEKYNQNSGSMQVKRQYERISGNWEKYFKRLLSQKYRQGLTVPIVLEILKRQNYLCALSGVPLTCTLKQGIKYKTNASFDRIIPGKDYSPENTQLVCSVVNSWRSDTDLEEFIWYCKQITITQGSRS